ncbi:MAG TPA: Yip1 family protein [Caulobacterales bacterium]|nr:Yip1 family protein [Caulobacterales bacterium]
MSTEQPIAAAPSGLVERVKNILLKPNTEWERIDAEPADVGKLYIGYVAPLAALAAICLAIGLAVFGIGAMFVWVHYSPVQAIVTGALRFVSAMLGVFVLGFVINALAPTFGSQQNQTQAHKVAVYGSTAGLLAGVFMIYPPLGALGILGLYSLVLIYLALPRVMKTPQDKRAGYFVSIIAACIVVGVVIAVVSSAITAPLMGPMAGPHFGANAPGAGGAQVEGKITLPNGVTIDAGQAQRAAEQLQQAYNNDGSVKTVDPARLAALLPASLAGGFTRVSQSTGSAGAMGAGAASAEAVYQRGDAKITLSVVHLGGMAALAGVAAAAGVQGSEETADGYTHMNTVNGRTITEEMSRSAHTAKYSVLSRNGVAVSAEGEGVSMEDVRAAVNAVGVERVEALSGT